MTTLGLGTAQLGMPYGITNTRGRPAHDGAAAILRTARAGGIVPFFAHGERESVAVEAAQEAVFAMIAQGIADGSLRTMLRGELIQQIFRVR